MYYVSCRENGKRVYKDYESKKDAERVAESMRSVGIKCRVENLNK